MRKLRWLGLFVLILISLSFLACGGGQAGGGGATPGAIQTQDSAKTIAWKTLMTDKQLYDTTFTALAALDKQGKLPAAVKAKAISLGNKYKTAHNAAVTMLLQDQPVSLEAVRAALDLFLTECATVGVK